MLQGLLSLRFIVFVLIGFTLGACLGTGADEEGSEAKWEVTTMPFNYQNLQVPREFWEKAKGSMLDDGVSPMVIEDFSVLPISMDFAMVSKDPKVLKDGKNFKLRFVEGGGKVDFFDYVVGRGEFYLRMTPKFEEEGKTYFFYISDSPGTVIDGDNWGNGCGQIFDLSGQIPFFTGDEGVRVTSVLRQYMHLLAGAYVFLRIVEDRLHMGYISLTDSRYPRFNCDFTE